MAVEKDHPAGRPGRVAFDADDRVRRLQVVRRGRRESGRGPAPGIPDVAAAVHDPRVARADGCTFCRIVRGELPASVVLDTPDLLAFLDAKPVFRGHVLLVPKRHVTTYKELPPALVPEFALTAQRLEVAVETGLDVPGSMVLVNNIVSQSVLHLHLHVIPRRLKDGLRFWLGPRHPYTDDDPPEGYAKRIRSILERDQ
jgi:histidine triad (HIT) family protein